MQTNDVLRRLRYALDLRDAEMVAMMNHWFVPVTEEYVAQLLRPDGSEDLIECSSLELERLLDGLIIARRGLQDPTQPPRAPLGEPLTNNAIMKKLRIAMSYREKEMLETLALGGLPVRSPELGAIFRKPTHKHYRECGDQMLRAFLKGLALNVPSRRG